jgi:hypothetical protein
MSECRGLARRYHWHSASVRDFVSEPHTAIVGASEGMILNLVDGRARPAQNAMLEIVRGSPEKNLQEIRKLILPGRHEVRSEDVDLKRLGAVLATAYQREFHDFASLLLMENLGPRTLQSLALVAEVVHGAPARFSDPARFSFAHGGKDGHPFPVPLRTFDESIGVLRRGLNAAKLGDSARIQGFRRLDSFVRAIERNCGPEADFEAVLRDERVISAGLGGRTVSNVRKKSLRAPLQLPLFS